MKKIQFGILLIISVGLLIFAVFAIKGMQFGAMAKAAEEMVMPPISVSTFVAEEQTWPNKLRAVGSIEPVQGVVLKAESPGIVKTINFKNGERVAAGDMLVQLDIGVEAAQLKSAQASARLTDVEFARARRLRESGNVPQSDLDRAIADLDRANAEVENIQAVIDRKTIHAPFSGKVGIRQINLGQYVSIGAPFVSLQANEQVYVNFALPQQALSKVKVGMTLSLKSDAYPDRNFEGSVTAVSPQVDPVTRTVELQGTLDNSDDTLRSGLFVEVEVDLPEQDTVITVAATAIIYAPYGNSVYVIEKNEDGALTVVQKIIRTGRSLGDFVSVEEGLDLGEEVVSAGTFKLFNGAFVSINNDMAPSPETDPTPPNT
ncbi:efflux RND transporter periplasmic adaptor subunit [Puniceicoccaceae bacterium]|nr:efflux RND transporter periplasmic adaptor subunit [Puniceicoccaceae bacterium]